MDLATVTASGLLAVLINVIGAFWLKERLRQSIKYEYDQDLAKLKSELDFELDKKKRLYEGKLTQYKKIFRSNGFVFTGSAPCADRRIPGRNLQNFREPFNREYNRIY